MLTRCPDMPSLARLLSGRLADDEAAPIEEHLAGCPNCATRAGTVCSEANDTLLTALRLPSARDPRIDAPEIDGLVARVIGSPSSQAATPTPEEPNTRTAAIPTPPAVGEQLGPYRVMRLLGEGGMGAVYAGEDPVLRRPVALKVIKGAGTDEARRRFLREARASAALDHEHVVPVWGVGEADTPSGRVPYIAMPLLKGESLSGRLKRDGKLPLAEALRVAREAASGLAVAHAAGLVHRDVKPANLWLEERPDGWRVRVLDFGLVHGGEGHEGEPVTADGAIVGTPNYMAPEQVRGERADARADVFALGAVLYECLMGRRAFRGEGLTNVLAAVLTHEPPLPGEADGIPREVSALVRRMLTKDAAARPASAADVEAELRRFEAEPAEAPVARPARGKPKAKWGVLAGFCVAAGLLMAVPIVIKVRTPDGKETTVTVESGSVSIKPDGTVVVTPEATKPEATQPEARKPEATKPVPAVTLKPLQARLDLRFVGHTRVVNALSMSPDGKTLVSGSDDRTVRVWALSDLWNHSDRVEARSIAAKGAIQSIALTPDGREALVACRGGALMRVDITQGKVLGEILPPTCAALSVANDSLGKRFALSRLEPFPAVQVGDPTTDKLQEPLAKQSGGTALAWLGDTNEFISSSNNGHVRIWDANTGKEVAELKHPLADATLSTPAVDAEGRYALVSAKNSGTVMLFDMRKRELVWSKPMPDGQADAVAIAPHGKWFAVSEKGRVCVRETTTGRELAIADLGTATVNVLTYTPDGKYLIGAVHGETHAIHMWKVAGVVSLLEAK